MYIFVALLCMQQGFFCFSAIAMPYYSIKHSNSNYKQSKKVWKTTLLKM